MNLPVTSHNPNHLQEWRDSGVSDAITALNVRSIDGQEAIELILSDAIAQRQKVQYVTAATAKLLEIYKPLENGGWWVSGINPLSCEINSHRDFDDMEWGQLKPDTPRLDPYKPGKSIKYEAPQKVGAKLFLHRVSRLDALQTCITLGTQYGEKFDTAIQAAIERISEGSDRPEKARRGAVLANNESRGRSGVLSAIQRAVKGKKYRQAQELLQSARSQLRGSADGFGVEPELRGLNQEDSRYWEWVYLHNLPILITEGAKKGGSTSTAGYPTFALPGITMAVRTKDEYGNPLHPSQVKLLPEIAFFATPGREFNLCFDYETKPQTIRNIERETNRLGILLQKVRCEFKVIQLPGTEKGVDEFIVARGQAAFHELFLKRIAFDHWQWRKSRRLSFPATVQLNQRYLGDLCLPATTKFVGIKSPKGTGKTESFKPIVESNMQEGRRTLLINHRVQLGQAICDRVGLPYVSELRSTPEGSLLGFGVCVDSLHPESQARFNAADWEDATVIIDEVEQVILHLLDAKTDVSKRRTTILEQLKTLLQTVAESEHGRIIVADADLSDYSIQYIWALLGDKIPVHLIVNDYRFESDPWLICNYDQRKPDQLIAALCEELKSGGKVWIGTQAQGLTSTWSTKSLECYLSEEFPHLKGLRIDRDSISDPTHPAYQCTSKLNEIAVQYDWIVASPTIETGVSIDIRGHFSSVWGILNGVVGENAARQALARVREPVPRHIWISKMGTKFIGNAATTPSGLLSGETQTANVAGRLIQTISYHDDLVGAYAQSLEMWAKFAARINRGMYHYRECVLDGLSDEGHIIETVNPGLKTTALIDRINALKDQKYQAKTEAISEAEDISVKEFETLKGKKAKTETEQNQERKFELKQRYQVEVTPDLVAKDDDGWYPKLRLFYFMGVGKVFLRQRDEQSLDSALKTSGPWIPTLNRSQLSTKIWLLEALGIQTLLNLDQEFNGGTKADGYEDAHPALRRLADLATKDRNAWAIKNTLGVTISQKMSPIQIAQTILGKLGIKLKFVGQIGGRSDRQRYYRYELPKDGRDEILAGWFARDEMARQEAVHTPPIDINNSQRSAA